MILRVAVVEDCAEDRDLLLRYLSDWAAPEDALRVETFSCGEDFLEAARTRSFDLAFLDIYLEGLSGMETAECLRSFDRRMLVAFLTRTSDYVTDGYRVRGFRYLLKPIRREILEECLTDAREEISMAIRESVSFGSRSHEMSIPADDVFCVTAAGNYICVHTVNGELRFREPISDAAERLPVQFVQVHRGDIINVQHVKRLESAEVVLRNGQRFSVSRPHRRLLRERYAAFH